MEAQSVADLARIANQLGLPQDSTRSFVEWNPQRAFLKLARIS
jgi:hypothetical protein